MFKSVLIPCYDSCFISLAFSNVMASSTEDAKKARSQRSEQKIKPFLTEHYEKIPVNEQRGAIRILKIDPGPPEQPRVYCELIPGTILSEDEYLPDEKRDVKHVKFRHYDALSWCWGKVPADAQIHIKKGDEMFVKNVQQDLVKALRALRHDTLTKYIWVDAVCINQDYGPEKNVRGVQASGTHIGVI